MVELYLPSTIPNNFVRALGDIVSVDVVHIEVDLGVVLVESALTLERLKGEHILKLAHWRLGLVG